MVRHLEGCGGVAVFQANLDAQDANTTQAHLFSNVVAQAKRVIDSHITNEVGRQFSHY